jgi:aldose sugar dehydrogenase
LKVSRFRYFTCRNVDKPSLVLITELTSSISSNIDENRRKKKKKLLFVLSVTIIIVILTIIIVAFHFNLVNMIIGQTPQQQKKKQGPSLQTPYNSLNVELVTEGLSLPTSMEFIDSNNILVLQKNTGTVHLVSNGIIQKKPVLKVQVDTKGERGLLGITHSGKDTVFLYFTESDYGDKPLRNRVYGYHWNGTNLVNRTLILDLPAAPGPYHQGGKLKIGYDNYLYAVIGDLTAADGLLQNHKDGKKPNDSSVILRVNPDNGSPVNNNPFYSNNYSSSNNNSSSNSSDYNNDKDDVESLLDKYYAYGIRNSFGMDFDPITGALWATENGEIGYDEVNLIKPGFNSGWAQVMGPIARNNNDNNDNDNDNDNDRTANDLVTFPGSIYADPVFSWKAQIGVTDIEFLNSSKLGDKYTNNIFVGDINNGNLYYFEVNDRRTGLKFDDGDNNSRSSSSSRHNIGLTDFVADNDDELSALIFGTGFGRITDIETGPDGFLYILSYEDGKIYRIVR